MSIDAALKNTPLEQEHVALGAKMVDFAGWNMPVQYEGILQEFEYNRKTVSIFDCSHMGEFLLEGDLQSSGLDRIVTQTLNDMPVKSCRYGTMLNNNGGTIDDLIVYRISGEKWMVVVNAANIDKDRQHFLAQLTRSAKFQDVSMQTAKLDLQGPLSREVLSRHFRDFGRFGRSGVEFACDTMLIGAPGLRWIEKNRRQEEQRLLASLDVAPGQDVRLTIDARLQLVLEGVADRYAPFCYELGVALLDAESGEVLALAGRPLLDPEGHPRWTTPALVWERTGFLGSVAKPFIALEQLDASRSGRAHKDVATFRPCTRVYGKPAQGGKTLKCDGVHGDKSSNPVEALARSCNFYFYEAATGLGLNVVAP